MWKYIIIAPDSNIFHKTHLRFDTQLIGRLVLSSRDYSIAVSKIHLEAETGSEYSSSLVILLER